MIDIGKHRPRYGRFVQRTDQARRTFNRVSSASWALRRRNGVTQTRTELEAFEIMRVRQRQEFEQAIQRSREQCDCENCRAARESVQSSTSARLQ